MKNIKTLAIIFSLLPLLCCSFKQDFDVKVRVVNVSSKAYDSVNVYMYPDKHITFYNVKPKDSVYKVIKYKSFTYPKREANASGAVAFKDDYFYGTGGNGLIDPPYALLQDEYVFYIWDNGITPIKDTKPQGRFAERHNISEMKK